MIKINTHKQEERKKTLQFTTYFKLPDLQGIKIVGVKDYYAGDNGIIYKAKCLNSKIELVELTPQYPDEKYQIQYVNIKIYNALEGLSNKLIAVHWLVMTAFDSSKQPYGFKVMWKDKNFKNNALKNLVWVYDPKFFTKNSYVYK